MEEKLRRLYWYCIGATRYAKYRRREKPFSAYKFYRAQCEYYFLQRYEQETRAAKTRLDLFVYKVLDQLPDSVLQQRYLYPEDERVMNRLFLELLDTMLHEEQATLSTNDIEALTEIIAFVRDELALIT